ncbi:MAG: hypothetical protein J1F11_07010 [Oscillospiraceae bacterium]|nr:hypothetical protein [Oscillospiraceae bacterium]
MELTASSTVQAKRKHFSPVLHYWKCGVKANMRMSMIMTFLHLAASPLVLLTLIIGVHTGFYDTGDLAGMFLGLGAVTTAIAAFLGMFIAIKSFDCLHKRSVVDMKFSLPLKSSQRFFADFLSGLFSYLAPFLITQLFSVLLAAYGLAFMEGKRFDVFAEGHYRHSIVCDYFTDVMHMLLQLILCGTLIMLMFYTLTVLVTVCCGSRIEAIIYSLLVNTVIPSALYFSFYSATYDLYGIYGTDTGTDGMFFLVTSAAGGLAYFLDWFDDYYYSSYCDPGIWAVLYLTVTFIYGLTAFLLYRKRRAEQVSKPFAFKLVYYIFISSLILGIYSLFYYEEISIIPMLIVSAVVYMVLEVVTNRGFRRFWLSVIKYGATVGGAAVLIFLIHRTDGLGMTQIVPPDWAVSSVHLDYDGYYGDFRGYYLGFVEPENIKMITDTHKAVLRNYNRHKKDYRSEGSAFSRNTAVLDNRIHIYYTLKGGVMIERWYPFLNWEASEIIRQIDLTDEYKTQVADYYDDFIRNFYSHGIEEDIEDLSPAELEEYEQKHRVYVDLGGLVGRRRYDNKEGISRADLYKNGFYDRLADAYSKDIMNISEENFYHSALKNEYVFSQDQYYNSIYFPESFSNTIEVLEQYGFRLPRVEELTDEEIYECLSNTGFQSGAPFYSAKGGTAAIYSESQWRNVRNIPDGITLHGQYGYYGGSNDLRVNNIYLCSIDSTVCDLFRAAEPRNIVGNGGYVIRAFKTTGAVPAELIPEAERTASENTLEDTSTEYLRP